MKRRLLICLWLLHGLGAVSAKSNKAAEILYINGLEKNQTGLLIEATVVLTEAIAIDDQQHRYFYQRGLSFFALGQVDHGIEDFKQAVILKTDELGVYLKLISLYSTRSQYRLVLTTTDQMLDNLPAQAAGAYFDKGRAYEALHLPHLAINAYQASINQLSSNQTDFKQMLTERITSIKLKEKTP